MTEFAICFVCGDITQCRIVNNQLYEDRVWCIEGGHWADGVEA